MATWSIKILLPAENPQCWNHSMYGDPIFRWDYLQRKSTEKRCCRLMLSWEDLQSFHKLLDRGFKQSKGVFYALASIQLHIAVNSIMYYLNVRIGLKLESDNVVECCLWIIRSSIQPWTKSTSSTLPMPHTHPEIRFSPVDLGMPPI